MAEQMKPEFLPRKFDKELGKAEFRDVDRLRRRNAWTSTILTFLLLALLVAGAWYAVRHLHRSPPAAEQLEDKEPGRDPFETYPSEEPDTE